MTREERLALDGADNPILFYGQRHEHGEFSNFSAHPVQLPNPFTGKPTVYVRGEHRYQAMKARTEVEHDYVVAAASPSVAKDRGREITLRDGWGNDYGDLCWYVMTELILAKTLQHPAIAAKLTATGYRHIYEDSPVDDIWGWRYYNDHRGKNLLGRAWMETRLNLFGARLQ